MHIVYLDVKSNNMLLADSGHLLIRSYYAARNAAFLKKADFTGTSLFVVHEVKDQVKILTNVNGWKLGILVATIKYGPATIDDCLCTGRFMAGR
ncbi:serine/threonine protein kinase [Echinococcus granulosus]|uniref:Serine/threonine protein kinase n=1 Tax=Echinococcus granulosus TaxID=6210 RepID=W6U022_ECHGR|nr:serine/threonine protein kinase [Echinococcus granulosus]EUB54358.1 serine/threonine protein kinase [Echinococcus granulosus]